MDDANKPFELRPTHPKAGVLLIHGLFESPFSMRDIGNQLYQQDYLVRAILLPGHGTTPSDLLHVTYQEWIKAVRDGMASLQQEIDEIYLIGSSTGASLALYCALQGAKINGMVLISPAIKIYSRWAFMSNWHRVISWAWKRAAWLCITPENDYAKYQSITFNSVFQVYQLANAIQKLSKTHQIHCSSLYVLTTADTTVSPQAIIDYFKKYANPHDKMLIYSSEVSHVGIPISPDNPHYGKQGDHVKVTHPLIKERVTFNPDFNFMMQEIIQFISCAAHHKTT